MRSMQALVTNDDGPESGFGMAKNVPSPTHPRKSKRLSSVDAADSDRLSSTGGSALRKDKPSDGKLLMSLAPVRSLGLR